MNHPLLSLNRWISARVLLALAALYALASLLLQIGIGLPEWCPELPIELSIDVAALTGLALAVTQLYRHRCDTALRPGWAFATVGMGFIAISETADWFNGYAAAWCDEAWFEIPLWLLAAGCLHRCLRLYAAQLRVRFWSRAGFIFLLAFVGLYLVKSVVSAALSGDVLDVTVDYMSLLSLLCYVSALAFTMLRRERMASPVGRSRSITLPALAGAGVLSSPATTPVAIGAVARTLFVDLHLFRTARYPTRYRILHRPVVRHIVNVGMALLLGGRIAPHVQRTTNRSLFQQSLDLLRMGLGQGIDAVSYYLLELYRPGGRAEAAYYLTRYETKNGLFAVLNAQTPRHPNVAYDLTDKAAFGAACSASGIATPPILLSAIDGRTTLHAPEFAFDRDLFAKLMRGRGTMKTGQFHRVVLCSTSIGTANCCRWLRSLRHCADSHSPWSG